jgi:hypothetical protein
MIHLKSFINFINEGAWYEGNEKDIKSIRTFISLKNDFNNPNELLTTPPLIGKNYSNQGLGNIKVYYGLYPHTPYSGVRGENGDPESQRAKRYIMDNLKRGNPDIVSMSTGETLENFIEKTLINNLPSKRVDYIVKVGTSEGLVEKMGRSLSILYPDAEVIDLTKIDYFSADDAIDKEALERAIESEMDKPRYADKEKTISIERYSTTKPLVEDWAKRITRSLRDRIEGGEVNPSFKIKSTGIKGSVRSALRPKYNTATEEFVNAVVHCVFGDEDGDTGKMVIIDDNSQQFIDFSNISNKIVEILGGIIDVTSNKTQEALLASNIFDGIKDNYKKHIAIKNAENYLEDIIPDIDDDEIRKKIERNIAGYVLYTFNSKMSYHRYSTKTDKDGKVTRELDKTFGNKFTREERLALGKSVFDLISAVRLGVPKYRFIDASLPYAIERINREKNVNSEDELKKMYKEYLIANRIDNNTNWTGR